MVGLPLACERREATTALIDSPLRRTPLRPARALSAELGCDIRLKLECDQVTGSFKSRGALVAVQRAPEGDIVVTASAGNHGLGIAFACSELRRPAEIFVPSDTDTTKIAALQAFGEGITVRIVNGSYDDTEVSARTVAAEPGRVFVSSYNDPWVVAGQSTVASEALDQWPQAEAVVVPVGGGGLLSGVALACAERGVHAWGVEPDRSPSMTESLRAGAITRIVEDELTAAQGLLGNMDPDSITFELVRDHAAGVLLVSEDELLDAVSRVYVDEAIVLEPSGAAALPRLAAIRDAGAKRIVCVLTGANVSPQFHSEIVSSRAGTTMA
jgi:threonine dehydratase